MQRNKNVAVKMSCADADFFQANVQAAGLPQAQTFAHSEQDNSFAKEYRMSILSFPGPFFKRTTYRAVVTYSTVEDIGGEPILGCMPSRFIYLRNEIGEQVGFTVRRYHNFLA
ncbi:hypothetical protein [Pinibacter aurantiacus]|uniref:Uncharacterized protein n=1 Tax=Pinibacter aurantiacus TaxID=2851599 RepID=A0A9E2S9S2_9BACT|nr:hypothetical protein [Pinibacter aurantiacus]MBV4359093.1 hypothetical protein [Pinibacter aurantiacus]